MEQWKKWLTQLYSWQVKLLVMSMVMYYLLMVVMSQQGSLKLKFFDIKNVKGNS